MITNRKELEEKLRQVFKRKQPIAITNPDGTPRICQNCYYAQSLVRIRDSNGISYQKVVEPHCLNFRAEEGLLGSASRMHLPPEVDKTPTARYCREYVHSPPRNS